MDVYTIYTVNVMNLIYHWSPLQNIAQHRLHRHSVFCSILITLVDYEAVLREIVTCDCSIISMKQEEQLGWAFSDGGDTSFVAEVQCCHLTGDL